MYINKVYTYGNIGYHKGVINYYYQITPINSLFAASTQQTALVDTMVNLILSINMPGMLFVKPRPIDNKKIIQAYEDSYAKYGRPEFKELKDEVIVSMKEILSKAIKYRYEIYFIITDGREEFKRKTSFRLFKKLNEPMNDQLLNISKIVEEEIFKKLTKNLSVSRLEPYKIRLLHQYLACPFDKEVADYYTTPDATELEHSYKLIKKHSYDTLYTRTYIVTRFQKEVVEHSFVADDVVNSLQLVSFPTDTIVKWDIEHTRKFKKDMTAKKEEIKKKNKMYRRLSGMNDKEAIAARTFAHIGEEVNIEDEKSKIRWQMMFRVRAKSKELLNQRCDILKTKLEGSKIDISYELGEQIGLTKNLFPYNTDFKQYVHLSDVRYFAQFNYLGGLYVGEEEEGMILTYTKPGNLPIFYEISNPLLGKTKTNAATTIFAGSTGSGKTQLADYEALNAMIFKGMRILICDPKDDRFKKVKLLGDQVARLQIGSKECPNGMFDCYLMHKDDIGMALTRAKSDIVALCKAIDDRLKINLYDVDRAHEDMLNDYKNNIIKQLTFTHLVQKFEKYDTYNAQQLRSLKKDPYIRLFFAEEDTVVDVAFNLTKPFNLVTFANMPLISEDNRMGGYNPNALEHRLFAILFSRISYVFKSFMKLNGGEENLVIWDEFKAAMTIPGALDIVEETNRQGRSWQTHLRIITQSPSDVPESILNNTGQMFIGALASNKEIEHVLTEMKLHNNDVIRSTLVDQTSDEGVLESKKYTFLFKDYNNRKCITKLIIPRVYEQAFRTLKEEESNV